MTSDSTPPSALVTFARGTIATLVLWPALRMAVEGGWGGPESAHKRTWLASAVVDTFEEANNKNERVPDTIYVEEMLLQVLADEFDVVLEDGSAQPVATSIVRLWHEIMDEGRVDTVVRIETLVEQSRGGKLVVDEKEASDEECQWADEDEEGQSGSGSDDEEAPQLLEKVRDTVREEPEIDEDGFMMVKSRGKGRHQ